jgi:hypothetical protein
LCYFAIKPRSPRQGEAVIALDSDEWKQLRHCYGPAEDIPSLLRQLAANPRPQHVYTDEPWFSLWSSLCHQGDVYDGSYASVPHIVEIGTLAAGPIDFGFFLLPACIEIARKKGRGPSLPERLEQAYFAALRGLHDCALRHADDDWDCSMAVSVAAALAAAKAQHQLAEALSNLDPEMIARIAATPDLSWLAK